MIFIVVSVGAWIWIVEVPRFVMRRESGENNEQSVKNEFLDVLSNSKRTLIVHDDGDDVPSSVYNDEEVLTAIKRRLDENRKLTIEILFNFNSRLKIYELAEKHDRLSIRSLNMSLDQRPEHDVHYKIADDGKYAYLSLHAPGARTESLNHINVRGHCRSSVEHYSTNTSSTLGWLPDVVYGIACPHAVLYFGGYEFGGSWCSE